MPYYNCPFLLHCLNELKINTAQVPNGTRDAKNTTGVPFPLSKVSANTFKLMKFISFSARGRNHSLLLELCRLHQSKRRKLSLLLYKGKIILLLQRQEVVTLFQLSLVTKGDSYFHLSWLYYSSMQDKLYSLFCILGKRSKIHAGQFKYMMLRFWEASWAQTLA